MRRSMAALIASAAAMSAYAGPQLIAVNQENRLLTQKLETCVLDVRTLYVISRARLPADPAIDPSRCAVDGKIAAKNSFDKVKLSVGNGKLPPELAEWRLDWMGAFDASVPQDGEIERSYLMRMTEAKGKVSRAVNKLDIAFE